MPVAPTETSDLQTSFEMNTQQILQVSTALHTCFDQGPHQVPKFKKNKNPKAKAN